MKYLISLITLSFLTFSAFAAEPHPARLHLETMLEKVEREFQPDFEKRKLRLITKVLWNRKSLNAHARVGHMSHRKRIIAIYGELMRNFMSEEAILWPICHELGHHLGGYPVYPNDGLSAEGQSDYWAAQVCMPRLFKREFVQTDFPPTSDLLEYHLCQEKFSLESDIIACARTLRGALEFHQKLYAQIRPKILKLTTPIDETGSLPRITEDDQKWLTRFYAPHEPLFTTPDSRVASRLIVEHPRHQCRLDTALAGVLSEPRPVCWFKNK